MSRIREVAQWVKAPAVKPSDLNLILQINVVEGVGSLLTVSAPSPDPDKYRLLSVCFNLIVCLNC